MSFVLGKPLFLSLSSVTLVKLDIGTEEQVRENLNFFFLHLVVIAFPKYVVAREQMKFPLSLLALFGYAKGYTDTDEKMRVQQHEKDFFLYFLLILSSPNFYNFKINQSQSGTITTSG